jgi:hypothetical protein
VPSLRHPRLPESEPVCTSRIVLAMAALVLFILTFTIQPFAGASLVNYLH